MTLRTGPVAALRIELRPEQRPVTRQSLTQRRKPAWGGAGKQPFIGGGAVGRPDVLDSRALRCEAVKRQSRLTAAFADCDSEGSPCQKAEKAERHCNRDREL